MYTGLLHCGSHSVHVFLPYSPTRWTSALVSGRKTLPDYSKGLIASLDHSHAPTREGGGGRKINIHCTVYMYMYVDTLLALDIIIRVYCSKIIGGIV